MTKLFIQLLDRLGSPKEQQYESVALTIVYCMFLSFMVVIIMIAMII
jgi:hypothetical protein